MSLIHTLLVLGRFANLPTVWSNCLAAWLLCGGGPWLSFFVVCAGATLLYLGGMFLNDAFDVEFDRLHRPERPIPQGLIQIQTVWRLGFSCLGAGWLMLAFLSPATAALSLSLALAIVLYDAVHKLIRASALVMALCRGLLYLVAASATPAGINGLTVWSGLALAAYVAGVSLLAARETAPGRPALWPGLLMIPPLALAVLINPGHLRWSALVLGLAFSGWTCRNLWLAGLALRNHTGQAVGGMLAGIVLVDWLAVADRGSDFGLTFILLFLTALILQQIAPAT